MLPSSRAQGLGWGEFGSLRSQAVEGSGTWSLEHGALVCTSLCPQEQGGKATRECEVWLWTEARTVGGADSH